jgi:hypothetical protein
MKKSNHNLLAMTLFLMCCFGIAFAANRWYHAECVIRKLEKIQTSPQIAPRHEPLPRHKLTTNDYVALYRFLDTADGSTNGSSQADATEILRSIGNLDSIQIRALAMELEKVLNDQNMRHRFEILKFAIESLANRDPKAAVSLLTHPSEGIIGNAYIDCVLPIWYQHDAAAAVQWIRQQIQLKDGPIDWKTLSKLPASLAPCDPALALSLMNDLRERGMDAEFSDVTRNATNDPARTAALEAIRHLPQGPQRGNLLAETWRGFADNLIAAGPDVSGQWLNSAALTAEENSALSDQIIHRKELSDQGYWLSWTVKAMSPDEMPHRVAEMVNYWTLANHRQAGEFITKMPEGKARHAAVQAFATTVAGIDRDAAEQWALTLPPGPSRDETLRKIRSAN